MHTTLVLMAVQMAGTLTPLVLFPETVFTTGLYALTLEGQYIIKNVVLIGVGLVLVQPCVAGVSSLSQQESETNVHKAVTRDTGSGSGLSLLAAASQRDDELAS